MNEICPEISMLETKELRMKGPIQRLHEWLARHKGKRLVDFTRDEGEVGEEPEPQKLWTCKLSMIKGHVGDRRLPSEQFVAEGRTKRQSEEAASVLAWEHLQDKGFLTQESLLPNNSKGPRPTWELPKRKMISNPLAYFDVSIEDSHVGRVVVEFFSDVAPQVAAAFARLFSSSAAGGTHHDKSSVTPPPFLGFRFDQVVRRSLLQLLPNTSDLKEGPPGDGEEAQFSLVHARPFLLTHDPNSLNPWGLAITTNKMPSLDGVSEVVGQVLRGFGVLREIEIIPVNELKQPLVSCCISGCGTLPEDYNLDETPSYEDGCYPCWPDDLVAGSGDKAGQSEAEMRLSAADVMRSEGNVAYREGDDTRALFKYTQSIRYLEWTSLRRLAELKYEHKKRMEEEKMKCYLNRASCLLRQGHFHKAAEDCRCVLAIDEAHPKALFRLGKALMGSKQLEQAVEAFQEAARLAPKDPDVRGALQEAKRVWRDRRLKEGKLYAGLFADGGLTKGFNDDSSPGFSLASENMKAKYMSDEGCPSMTPELEAAFDKFGTTKLKGHPHTT